MLARISEPSRQTAAAVSSQEVSIPRTSISLNLQGSWFKVQSSGRFQSLVPGRSHQRTERKTLNFESGTLESGPSGPPPVPPEGGRGLPMPSDFPSSDSTHVCSLLPPFP